MILSDQTIGVDGEEAIKDEPRKAAGYLALIEQAQREFDDYQDRCENVDKLYADLNRLASIGRDRQFQLFWANCEVLKPSIYARPPVPVVVPRFNDRRPIPRVASEMLERAITTQYDLTDLNQTMLALRDDLAIVARGAAWVRYETDEDGERVCVDHVHRSDFLHDPARSWAEVDWVARRCWMTRQQVEDRFEISREDALMLDYQVDRIARDRGGADDQSRAIVWEMWVRSEKRVVWFTEGREDVLDDQDPPHLKLEGFFPCPRPAYGTTQRGSLVPVPDMLFYKDQLEEINQLTNRIHRLTDAVQARGFYQAGGDVGDAVEKAMLEVDDRRVMIPVPSMAAIGPNSAPFVMLPIDMIAQTIAGLIEMRRTCIDDVYQIMGLSDIMRGSTEAQETATAQQIKAQYGSVRIRDKQSELVRVARDITRIVGEIMAEHFDRDTLLDYSQMEIPTDSEINKQKRELTSKAKQIEQAVAAAQQQMQSEGVSPSAPGGQEGGGSAPVATGGPPPSQPDPQAAEQAIQQAQQQLAQMGKKLAELEETPTIEDVMDLLRDQRTRPFTLDIETDSTIQPDEDADKQRRTEFLQVFAQASQALSQMIAASPAAAPFAGEMLKFVLAPYRAGRQMEGAIDDFVEQMVAQAEQPQPPSPEEQKLQAQQAEAQARMQIEQQKLEADQAARQQEMQATQQIEQAKLQAEAVGRQQDAEIKQREADAKLQQIQAQMQRDAQKGDLELRKLEMEMQRMQLDAQVKTQLAQQQAVQSERSFEQQERQGAQAFEQQQTLNAQKAAAGPPRKPGGSGG